MACRAEHCSALLCARSQPPSICSAPALALSQRGHTPAFTFGGFGQKAGNVNVPLGVAVSEATGNVYVVDAANNRVDRFDAQGHFIEAWGWGVKTGAKALETCTTSCQKGLEGHGKGELEDAEGIAVDNSTSASDPSKGDVYVEVNTTEEYGAIDKFGPEGKLLGGDHRRQSRKRLQRRTARRTPRDRGRPQRGPPHLQRRRSLPPGQHRKERLFVSLVSPENSKANRRRGSPRTPTGTCTRHTSRAPARPP